ncbi:MAG: sensory histidine kinase AtoS [Methanocella sp. PtaU1.Bin125]|nr:MAG: sensory histidine kinase AtoS [Methanocella sp. PtaU1.Bin125]
MMILQISLEVALFLLIVLLAGLVAGYTWRRRAMPGGRYFCILMAAMSFWALVCALELATDDPVVWAISLRLEYAAVTWAGPLWLLFVLDYGFRDRWPITRKMSWLWAMPLIITVLALTNQWHGLIWYRGPEDPVFFGFAIGLWINLFYTYVLVFTGLLLLVWAAIRSFKKNYLAATALLIGTLLPVFSSILYMTGIYSDVISQITPFALMATVLLFTWSVFGQRLFDIVPAARETLVRDMIDGILVLDEAGRIADLNPAAMRLFGITEDAIGQQADVVLSQWPGLAGCCHGHRDEASDIVIEGKGGPLWIDIRASPLRDRPGRFRGRLVALTDVTRRKQVEEKLTRSNMSLLAEVNERKHIEEELKRSNDALQKEIAERTRAEERLAASLKEKELLLKEIHHRVKNNLQIISSLISLQMVNMDNDHARTPLQESQSRIRTMALIHEKLYQSKDLASIDFREYLESLINYLARTYAVSARLTVDKDIADVSLDIDTAIPCGLIVNELFSNSLKYAFAGRESGTIRVSFARAGDQYRLAVCDDGVGLPPGLDYRNTASLGLMLVATLTEQIGGNLEHPGGPGTAFVVTFPGVSR